jgi:hypothetical protein
VYLNKFEIVPPIYPSPASSSMPPPPIHLINPPMYSRRDPSPSPPLTTGGTTNGNRSRREPGKRDRNGDTSRRRSSRLLEEELGWKDMRAPILPDLDDAHQALAVIAYKHFERQTVRETDVITSFLYAVKTKGESIHMVFIC